MLQTPAWSRQAFLATAWFPLREATLVCPAPTNARRMPWAEHFRPRHTKTRGPLFQRGPMKDLGNGLKSGASNPLPDSCFRDGRIGVQSDILASAVASGCSFYDLRGKSSFLFTLVIRGKGYSETSTSVFDAIV